MKTDLEIAQKQLELALKEIKSIKDRNVELLYDYVFEAHSLVKKLTIPHVVGRSELLFAFIKAIKEEFEDQNWDYLDFIADRVIGKQ